MAKLSVACSGIRFIWITTTELENERLSVSWSVMRVVREREREREIWRKRGKQERKERKKASRREKRLEE